MSASICRGSAVAECFITLSSDSSEPAPVEIDNLTREQMKALLEWPSPDPCVTDDMLRVAIQNRINLGRLSWEQLEQKAA